MGLDIIVRPVGHMKHKDTHMVCDVHAYFVIFVDAARTVWRKSDVLLPWRRRLRGPAEAGAAGVRAASAAACFDRSRFPDEMFLGAGRNRF